MSNITYTGKNLPSMHLQNFSDLLTKATAPVLKPRPYTARVTRTNPTAFVFLLDQSSSMGGELETAKGKMKKCDFLVDAVNNLLNQLISECRREGEYRNYMDVCVIGYGGDKDNTAKYAWEGSLSTKSFVTIQELKDNPLERQGTRGLWVSSKAHSQTPMKQAIELARDSLVQWLATHTGKDISPPVVINLTDGAATDADSNALIEVAREVKSLKTMDGNVLFFNVHLSSSGGEPVLFPCRPSDLPNDTYANTLFSMSSDLPAVYTLPIARITGRDPDPVFTAMAYNANPIQIIQLLNIGTSVSRRQPQ